MLANANKCNYKPGGYLHTRVSIFLFESMNIERISAALTLLVLIILLQPSTETELICCNVLLQFLAELLSGEEQYSIKGLF